MAALAKTATATVLGGFFHQYGPTMVSIQGKNFVRRTVRMALGTRTGLALREVMETLNGAVAGSAASKTLGRIANSTELGGARTIETNTLVSANTAAGDITEINADLLAYSTKTTFGDSPVANGDNNPLGTR